MNWWNIKYPDNKTLFIALPVMTLFITLVGTDHELSGLLQQKIVYQKLLFNYIFIAGLWFLVRLIIHLGDQYWPWDKHSWKRGLIQVVATLFISSVLMYFMVDFRQFIIPDWHLSPNTFMTTDIPIAFLYILLVNYSHYYWCKSKSKLNPDTNISPAKSAPEKIKIKIGKKVIFVNADHVAYAYREGDFCFIRTFDHDNHILNVNLKSLEAELCEKHFYRLNRKLLINKEAVKGFRTLSSRKIEVEVEPEYLGDRLLNKNRAASFKKWLNR